MYPSAVTQKPRFGPRQGMAGASEGSLADDRSGGVPRARILVIEDDPDIAGSIADCLSIDIYDVATCHDGAEGLRLALTGSYDALVVDRLIPGIDGLSLIRRLRDAGISTPILMLTALGSVQDRVEGLDAGADDYLVKPFATAELQARLRSVLRRLAAAEAVNRLVAGPITMDLLARKVERDGVEVRLQPREFRLLEELLRAAGTFVPRHVLIERVWNLRFDPRTKIVETHMSRLRAKLNENGPDVIETSRGLGYRIGPDA